MNIASLKDFFILLQRAWDSKQVCLIHIIDPDVLIATLKQGKPESLEYRGTLLQTVRYYQEIQMQRFYPCFIDLSIKREDTEFQELIAWLNYQERHILLVFLGPVVLEILKKECVSYYIGAPEDTKASIVPQSCDPSLRNRLLEFFQSDCQPASFPSRIFVTLLLDHISLHYKQHRCKSATSEVLEKVFLGLQGTMPDPSILARHIKWSLFQYLRNLKSHQEVLNR